MFNNVLLMGAASAAGAGSFTVDDSVRFNPADSPRLYRTPTVLGNRMTGSISLWYKRCNIGSIQQLFNAGAGDDITFNASDKLTFIDGSVSYITTQVFRDPTAWGNLLFAWDTTLAAAGDRLRIYHNGVEITAFDTETNPSQYDQLEISNTVRQTIGANESNTEEFDGYLSQIYYIDGQQLTPTSFGEFDDNGVWRPIVYSATTTTPAVSHVSNDSTGVNATTFTFSSQALGAAAADRRIVVCVGFQGGGSAAGATGVTVGGVTATRVVQSAANSETICSIWWAEVPTGTTGDVVITAGASKGNCGVSCYRLTGADTILSTDSDSAAGSGAASTGTVGSTGNSVVVGQLYLYGTALRTTTWSGLTEDIDAETEGAASQSTASDVITDSSVAVSATPSGASYTEVFTLASFGSSAYGINGFFLDFANSSLLGLDAAVAASTTTYRYLKLNVTEGGASTTYLSLGEMEYYVGATLYPTQTMTADDAPSPLVASASSALQDAYLAFNDDVNTHWLTQSGVLTGSLTIDLGSGNGIAPDSFRLCSPETPDRTPNNFTIQGSNDDSDYTVLATYAGFSTVTPPAKTFFGYAPMSNGNNFISSGLAAADQVTDTPTKNFCTWSSIDKSSSLPLSDGNLVGVFSSSWINGRATFSIPSSGKWSLQIQSSTLLFYIGIVAEVEGDGDMDTSGTDALYYYANEPYIRTYRSGSAVAETTNVPPKVAVDTNMELLIDKDNDQIGVVIADTVYMAVDAGVAIQDTMTKIFMQGYNTTVTCDFGQGGYVPSQTGYKALSTANLAAPQRTGHVDSQFVGAYDTGANIVATLNAARDETWTGYINMYRMLSGSTGANWQFSDDTANQLTLPGPSPGAKSSFINPSVTGSSATWNGYSWRVGADYGVYTAEISHTNGADTDQAHGLTSDSSRFLAHSKRSDAADEWWWVHPDQTSGNNVNFYWAAETATEYVTVDSTNVTVKSTNATGTYRVIVWAEMSGWRKFSGFTGNSNADGPVIWTGGTPKFYIGKRSTAGEDYHSNLRARDPNGTHMIHQVALDWYGVENTSFSIDGLAGAVKLRSGFVQMNGPAMIAWTECTPFGGDGVSPATVV